MNFTEFLISAAAFGVSTFLTFLVMRISWENRVLDIPNERSSHESPVPRGGGIAIILLFLAYVSFFPEGNIGSLRNWEWKGALIAGALVAAVGALDDFYNVEVRWRISVHLISAVLALFFLPSFPQISAFGHSLDLGAIAYPLFALAIIWHTNLFNFMDGIDGIASIEAISALLCGGMIMFWLGESDWLTLFVFLAASTAGFLLWNWPPAKIFMGDSGSGFLGFTLAILAIMTSIDGPINIWSWLILLGVFIVDATITLLRRAINGESWYRAHRSHAYQILASRLGSHKKVTVGTMVLNIIWLLPLAYLASIYPYWGAALCLVAWMPLVVLAFVVGSGRTEISSA